MSGPQWSADVPGVLIVMSDRHSARVMGVAVDPVVRTPNLDALAVTGTALDNLYCQTPLCFPSRMSFLTGAQPGQNGVMTNERMPAPGHPTYAHDAGAAGYRRVGKTAEPEPAR